jgi:acetyl esterase/lipase
MCDDEGLTDSEESMNRNSALTRRQFSQLTAGAALAAVLPPVVRAAAAVEPEVNPTTPHGNATTRVVTYTSEGRPPKDGELTIPQSNPTRTAVLLLHGAGAVPITSHWRPRRTMLACWQKFYARNGIATFNVTFTLCEPPGPVYPLPIVDAKNAIQYLRMHADEIGIHPDRILVQGHSGGARMGGNLLVHPDSEWFRSFGAWPDVSDAVNGFIGFYGGYTGATGAPSVYNIFYGGPRESDDPSVQERWHYAESIAFAGQASGPALLIPGDADRIPVAMSDSFAKALQEHGVEAELIVVPGEPHAFDVARERRSLSQEELAGRRPHPAELTVYTGELTDQGEEVGHRIVDWITRQFTA